MHRVYEGLFTVALTAAVWAGLAGPGEPRASAGVVDIGGNHVTASQIPPPPERGAYSTDEEWLLAYLQWLALYGGKDGMTVTGSVETAARKMTVEFGLAGVRDGLTQADVEVLKAGVRGFYQDLESVPDGSALGLSAVSSVRQLCRVVWVRLGLDVTGL
jgi:hypothetical protein